MTVQLLTRAEVGYKAKTGPAMTLPARRLWVHHSVTAVTDKPLNDLLGIERVGVTRFGRMSYSYLSHPAGVLAEAAALTVGAHTEGYNSTTLALCFVGNYQVRDLTDEQVEHLRWLYWHLVDVGALERGAPIDPHRLVKQTACPGERIFERMAELRTHVLSNPTTPGLPSVAGSSPLEELLWH